jgi:hypothetical protein
MRKLRIISCAAAIGALGFAIGAPSLANAATLALAAGQTFSINFENCTNCSGTGPWGSLSVASDGAGGFNITATTVPNVLFHQSQGANPSPGLYFDIAGLTSASIVSSNGGGSVVWTANTAFNGSLDAFANGNVGIFCSSGVAGNTCGSQVVFDVKGSNLTLTNINGNNSPGTNLWFVVDVAIAAGQLGCSGSVPCTGPVAASLTSAVPEPATWGMMLLGFVGLGFAFRQSRRKISFA